LDPLSFKQQNTSQYTQLDTLLFRVSARETKLEKADEVKAKISAENIALPTTHPQERNPMSGRLLVSS